MKERFYGDFIMWEDIKDSILTIGACIGLMLLLIFSVNSCSSTEWNSGDCPDCEVRYELRGASKGLKYYACPKCGREVERF